MQSLQPSHSVSGPFNLLLSLKKSSTQSSYSPWFPLPFPGISSNCSHLLDLILPASLGTETFQWLLTAIGLALQALPLSGNGLLLGHLSYYSSYTWSPDEGGASYVQYVLRLPLVHTHALCLVSQPFSRPQTGTAYLENFPQCLFLPYATFLVYGTFIAVPSVCHMP